MNLHQPPAWERVIATATSVAGEDYQRQREQCSTSHNVHYVNSCMETNHNARVGSTQTLSSDP